MKKAIWRCSAWICLRIARAQELQGELRVAELARDARAAANTETLTRPKTAKRRGWGAGGHDRLLDDLARLARILLEKLRQPPVHGGLDAGRSARAEAG